MKNILLITASIVMFSSPLLSYEKTQKQPNYNINYDQLKKGNIDKKTLEQFGNQKLNFNFNDPEFNKQLQNVSNSEFGKNLTPEQLSQLKDILKELNGQNGKQLSNSIGKIKSDYTEKRK